MDICKQFSCNLVNAPGNIPCAGIVPRFSDLEVVSLSLTMIRKYAKDIECLFTIIISKISALTVLQYINKINNTPIERVKYTLV